MDTNVQKYLAFSKTVELGSFTSAARALHYTQSGVSRMIADLERDWNVSLLERGRAGVSLTSEGRALLPFAEEVCAAHARLQAQVDDLNGLQSGLIRIGTFSSVAAHWLPNIVKELQKDHPGIDYELVLGDYAEIEGWIAEGRVDCGFVRLPTRPEFDVLPLERDELFLVSKVYPHNAGRDRIFDSCRASLDRLGTGALDLYLLHWRGDVPLAETVACMEELRAEGLIRRWGVSNFDVADMQELMSVPGGDACAVNQVLYHLGSRGIEFDLLPWQDAHGIPLMAYCPLAQAGRLARARGLLRDPSVAEVAARHDATPAQVLLAFVIRSGTVVAIPKASTPAHARDNAAALDLRLTGDDLALLDRRFPAPARKTPLDME